MRSNKLQSLSLWLIFLKSTIASFKQQASCWLHATVGCFQYKSIYLQSTSPHILAMFHPGGACVLHNRFCGLKKVKE